MALQFHRAIKHMEIWSASSEGFSFVITYGSPTGPGFHGRAGLRRRPVCPPLRRCSAARVSAAQALLDRGWGKPAQPHTGEDDKDIRITIRQIVEGGDKD
jgi:hypothetical protein